MNIKKDLILPIFLLLIITGCQSDDPDQYFIAPDANLKEIKYDRIELDTIKLDKIESSYVGSTDMVDDTIYFTDQKFGFLFLFDNHGKFLKKELGQGKGPKEISTREIIGHVKLPDHTHYLLGTSNDWHIFNQSFERQKSFMMPKAYEKAKNRDSKVSPDQSWLYTLSYQKLILRTYNGEIFFTIQAMHPKFNFLSTPKEYYNESRILAKMDINNGEVLDLLGRFSPVYRANPYNLNQVSMVNFDISDDGDFLVNFEADSLIYRYDKNFKIKKSFGFSGRDMNYDFKESKTPGEFREIVKSDRDQGKYYNWLECIDETKLVFRSYTKGSASKTDGLQIYENDILVADLDVPKNFMVRAYSAPYYYSNVYLNEENETMQLYKFKLSK